MRKQKKKENHGRQLRDAAEEKLAQTPGTPPAIKDRTLEEIVHELQVHQIELEMQNEELRRAQLASEESRSKYIDLYDFSPVGYFTFTHKALIAEVNLTGSALLGAQRQKLINGRFRRFVAPGDQDLWDQHIMSVLKLGEKQSCDLVLRRADGTTFHAWLESIRMGEDVKTPVVRSVIMDITGRKQAEVREQLAREVMELLNRLEGSADAVREILQLVKKFSGFEAVGIRLREGDDFPYYETNGFPGDFVQAERYLCERDKEGKIIRDGQGNPVLECMCGYIVCGRTNPALTFFTEGGSFWSNCTTELLASTTEEDRQARTRNRCNGEGYESVALIPLRSGDEIIGLLQLNDRRKNQFTQEMIRFFEGLGASIGVALSRKRVEDALRKSEESFRDLYEEAPNAMYSVGTDGIILRCNRRAELLLGYPADSLVGKPVLELYADTPDGKQKAQQLFDKFRAGEKIIDKELQMQRADGTRVWVSLSVNSIKDDGGQISGNRSIAVDITERKQAEEALKQTREMLVQSEKLAALGKLTDGASHEILNPLNILSLRLQVLEMTENLSDKTKEALKIAKVQVERIVKVTHGISEFSCTKALYMTTVDLRELMEDVFSLTASRLKAENVTFDFQYQADIPSLSLDKFRIEQVILNLVSNAIDAMKDGKEKLLRVTAALDSSEEKKNVRISFSDNGTGIKVEDMKRIFEPFFTTKDPDKGKGLGLSVCYGIIQDHGGTIRAENNAEGGATFVIELPVS